MGYICIFGFKIYLTKIQKKITKIIFKFKLYIVWLYKKANSRKHLVLTIHLFKSNIFKHFNLNYQQVLSFKKMPWKGSSLKIHCQFSQFWMHFKPWCCPQRWEYDWVVTQGMSHLHFSRPIKLRKNIENTLKKVLVKTFVEYIN